MYEASAADPRPTRPIPVRGKRPPCRAVDGARGATGIPYALAAGCLGCWGGDGTDQPDAVQQAAVSDAGMDVASAPDADGAKDAADPFGATERFWIDAGVATANKDGQASLLSFQVPAGTTSVEITFDGPAATLLTLAELSGPDGRIVVPKTWLAESKSPYRCTVACPNRIAAGPGSAAFLVPNTPAASAGGGAWTLRAFAFSAQAPGTPLAVDATLTVGVHAVRRPDVATRKGRIDLNLCMSGAFGIGADIALQHARIQDALSEVRTLFAGARIEIGAVRVFDTVVPSMIVQHGLGADAEIGDALAAIGEVPEGVNILFVQRIFAVTEAGAVPVLGVAGGIPGPVRPGGGRRSGVVIGLELGAGQPDVLGRTLAHEIAHWLGLFHTTEAPPASGIGAHDAIPDTGDDDVSNLMHWSPAAGSGKLTLQQTNVLHGHPLVGAGSP
ncbi:MAG: hypothetical protein EXR79_00475 [Myxococcales bacterium]|nr:hypothetical protein [Myxococcales bacterium]